MNRRLLAKVVIDSLASRRLLDHPFYVRWSRGDVSVDELRTYAEQYRHFEAQLPGVLRTVAAAGGAARTAVENNLADEAEKSAEKAILLSKQAHEGAGR